MIVQRLHVSIAAAKGQATTAKNPRLSDLNNDWKALRRYEIELENRVIKTDATVHDRLFPARLLVNDSYSKRLSEQMRHWLAVPGVKRKGDHKSFHCFRVNVITMLTDEGANTAQMMKIVGHKSAGSDDVHMRYVRELPKLAEVGNASNGPYPWMS